MSTTFDLSYLRLATGTHSVAVVAKAVGYFPSEMSNSVTYVKSAS